MSLSQLLAWLMACTLLLIDFRSASCQQPASAQLGGGAGSTSGNAFARLQAKLTPGTLSQDERWRQLVDFYWRYPESPEALKAAALWRQTASPLDVLQRSTIPVAERFAWQPQQLVAVLGEHRGRCWEPSRLQVGRAGQVIVTAGQRTIRIWDGATLQEWPDSPLEGDLVALSPCGTFLATATYWQTDNFWSATQRIEIWHLHRSAVRLASSFALREGQAVAVPRQGKRIDWPLADFDKKRVAFLSFVADGMLACTSAAGWVALVDVHATPPAVRRSWLLDPNDRIPSSARYRVAPHGSLLTDTGDTRGGRRLMSLAGAQPKTLVGLNLGSGTEAFSSDGKRFAAVEDASGTVHIWDLEQKVPQKVQTIAVASVYPHSLVFTPDNSTLLCCSGTDNRLRICPLTAAKRRELQLTSRDHFVELPLEARRPTLALAGDRRLIVAGSEGAVQVWDYVQRKKLYPTQPAPGILELARISPDGRQVVVVSRGGEVLHWHLVRGTWRMGGTHPSAISAPLALSFRQPADSIQLIGGEEQREANGALRYQNIHLRQKQPQPLGFFPIPQHVHSVILSPGDRRAVTSGYPDRPAAVSQPGGQPGEVVQPTEGQVRIWSARESGWQLQRKVNFGRIANTDEASSLESQEGVLSRDGRFLAFRAGLVRLFRLELNRAVEQDTIPKGGLVSAFSPDCRTLVAAGQHSESEDGYRRCIYFWDITGRRCRHISTLDLDRVPISEISGGSRYIEQVHFSPDGSFLAVRCSGGELHVWSLETRKRILHWQAPGPILNVDFALDSRHLLVGNRNGTIYILRLAGCKK